MTGERNYWDTTLARRLSRRKLLGTMAAGGLGIAGASIIGCGSGKKAAPSRSEVTPVASNTPSAASNTPRSGGILTVVQHVDPETFDIHASASSATHALLDSQYSGLLQFDPLKNTEVIPDLAEKWDVSPDARVYTFHLRKEVKWHDGAPFTAEDAKFSVDRMRGALEGPGALKTKTAASGGAALASVIGSTEVVDPYTLRITLKRASASILFSLAAGYAVMVPKHVVLEKGDLSKLVVGTGPYKFKSFQQGVSFEVVKNPDYYVKGRPYLDGIRWFIIPDPGTKLAAFKTKKVLLTQHWPEMSEDEAKQLERDLGDKIVVDRMPTGTIRGLYMNMTRKPWSDVRVRRAAHLAFDRDAFIKIAGSSDVITGPIAPGTGWGHTESDLRKLPGWRQPKTQDIADAKKLLAEAGYPSGFKGVISARAAGFEQGAQIFVDQLKQIGIDLELKILEPVAGLTAFRNGDYEVAYQGRSTVPDPDGPIGELYLTGASWNFSKYSNPKVDDLFAQQSQAIDKTKRNQLIVELEKILFEDMPMVWSGSPLRPQAFWKEVRNFKGGWGNFNNLKYQDVWLAQ